MPAAPITRASAEREPITADLKNRIGCTSDRRYRRRLRDDQCSGGPTSSIPWARQAAASASTSAGDGGPAGSGSSADDAGRLNERTKLSNSPFAVMTSQRASSDSTT